MRSVLKAIGPLAMTVLFSAGAFAQQQPPPPDAMMQ